jgi:hypothetical protein
MDGPWFWVQTGKVTVARRATGPPEIVDLIPFDVDSLQFLSDGRTLIVQMDSIPAALRFETGSWKRIEVIRSSR